MGGTYGACKRELIIVGQNKVHRFGCALNVRDFCGAHHRGRDLFSTVRQGAISVIETPCFSANRGYAVNDHTILLSGGIVFQLCIGVLLQAFGRFRRNVCKAVRPPARCTESWLYGPVDKFCHLPLFFPENQVIVPLNRDK